MTVFFYVTFSLVTATATDCTLHRSWVNTNTDGIGMQPFIFVPTLSQTGDGV